MIILWNIKPNTHYLKFGLKGFSVCEAQKKIFIPTVLLMSLLTA